MSWFFAWFAQVTLMKVVGLAGQAIFGTRFLVQWLASERAGKSVIPLLFWYISVVGGILTLIYAVYIQEPVFIIAQVGGLIVYLRNLYFIYQDRKTVPGLMDPDRP